MTLQQSATSPVPELILECLLLVKTNIQEKWKAVIQRNYEGRNRAVGILLSSDFLLVKVYLIGFNVSDFWC